LKLLTDNHEVVRQRSNSLLRELIVLVLNGKHDRAIGYLRENYFHVREGGGRVHDVFVDAHLLRGLARLKEGKPKAALADFEAASTYPENLSVGRPSNDPRAPQVAYYTGVAYEALGDPVKAAEFFERAVEQKATTTRPETRFYKGLALEKLGRESEASGIFSELNRTGSEKLSKVGEVDFFAKFGEQETEGARRGSAHYVGALGLLGLGRLNEAKAELKEALQFDVSQVWARYQLSELE
jgi:tetratricopeptide (TPR) repeat protein